MMEWVDYRARVGARVGDTSGMQVSIYCRTASTHIIILKSTYGNNGATRSIYYYSAVCYIQID